MAGLFGRLGDSLKEVAKGVAKSKDAALESAERRLRSERIKGDIRDLREKKDQLMMSLAHKVYEQYTNGNLTDPDQLAACQEIKLLQWQIDEHWVEVNNINAE